MAGGWTEPASKYTAYIHTEQEGENVPEARGEHMHVNSLVQQQLL